MTAGLKRKRGYDDCARIPDDGKRYYTPKERRDLYAASSPLTNAVRCLVRAPLTLSLSPIGGEGA